MEKNNNEFHYATSEGKGGIMVGYLRGFMKGLDEQFNDMSINLTICEGRDMTGTIVAERIDGEWHFMDD